MACTSMNLPSSPTSKAAKNVFKEHNDFHPSDSYNDLRNQRKLQRSFSENHLCCSVATHMCASSLQPKLKSCRSFRFFPFHTSTSIIPTSLELVPNSITTSLFDPETSKHMDVTEKNNASASSIEEEVKKTNWMERLLEIRSHWKNRQQRIEDTDGDDLSNIQGNGDCNCDGDVDECLADYNSEKEEEEMKYDRTTFANFLARVPWSDAKLFSKLAFLSNMAYVIPEIKIKANDLRRCYGLQLVTSSLEKKAEAAAVKEKLDQDSTNLPAISPVKTDLNEVKYSKKKLTVPTSVYGIAASAASYVQSRHSSCGSKPKEGAYSNSYINGAQLEEEGESSPPRVYRSEVAAAVAASTMTVVVAAGEKEKQEAAIALQSLHSSPCEWFICDDVNTYTRCFVIQGSDSLASWQANLFFEPTKFEGTNGLVHRGIYEAAKGIYEQFMPEIIDHLTKHGERAKLQFTGHSLGGSLSLLVHLMLLARKVVEPSTLRPVVTFGSPFVLCGGQKILNDLGLEDGHIQSVMMHRDIVPRAFSCNYPNHVAQILKRLNGSFRSHPCLIKNKLLYSPLGKLFILQPDKDSSPPHPFIPPGSALYALDKTQDGYSLSVLNAFLNCPHPLETLSDPAAYGSGGTILRDHDSSNYLKAVNDVLRQNTKPFILRVRNERNQHWPLFASPSPHSWNNEHNLESNKLSAKETMTV